MKKKDDNNSSADNQEIQQAPQAPAADASPDSEQSGDSKAPETAEQTTEQATEQNSSAATATAESAAPVAAKPTAGWPGKLALVLSLAALGASGYLYWLNLQQSQQNALLRAEINGKVETTISGARSDLNQNISNMNSQLGALKARADSDQRHIDELQQRLTSAIQQVTATQHNNRKDWLLAEVEYLLRLANQRILMENTPSGALQLLKSADKILAETDDVTIYDVRKALAADIAALEAVPSIDTEGLFLKLDAMNHQVDALRVTPVNDQHQLPEMLEQINPETVEASWASGLKEAWASAMDKLGKLVVIQHRDEPVEPLLSPDQTYYLQQNLHLMLEQAQLALLQRKQPAYDSALNKAEQWISTYFEADDGTTQALLRGVRELKPVQVAPELPDISGSLGSLKEYLQRMTELKQKGAA
ncbi:uroporphyrinogen-III C-methyltransferase [Marinobacterium arenosum]|uniref:uroporphyrinogen-III C-methyltransferase n=1 Tax=Marinobacterium arenosum TaxID=2862496 RepID=UPI001C9888EA|nr:uroporphyrinogen-III C-methyltransferase [Marinobacterium arenosum]MBY4676910.1 uroporphyrinogen-III C-methyltransferase [Marinobacterium arenosum]